MSTLVLTKTESQSRGSVSFSEVGKKSVDKENKGCRDCNTQVRPWDAAQQETAADTARQARSSPCKTAESDYLFHIMNLKMVEV